MRVSAELGVTASCIYQWIKKAGNNTLSSDGELSPNKRSPREKFRLLLESRKVTAEKQGEWLRAHGLHSEHLTQYEQELSGMVEEKDDKKKEELKRLRLENRNLKRELERKDKALAETAALLALKKKVDEIWGDPRDD